MNPQIAEFLPSLEAECGISPLPEGEDVAEGDR
jgi:hypothetical protein